jgi:hypothetical protein
MTTEQPLDSDIAVATLRLLPPKVRASILEDDEFRRRLSLELDAVIKFERTGAEFVRSSLFRAVRQVLSGALAESPIVSKDGATWRVSRNDAGEITVGRDTEEVSFSEFACFSSDVGTRTQWFDQQTAKFCIGDDRTREWREILTQRALDDEELGHLLDDFRLTPVHAVAAIGQRFRRRNFTAADLVPSGIRYFDRLVGEPQGATNVRDFVSTVVAPNVRALILMTPTRASRPHSRFRRITLSRTLSTSTRRRVTRCSAYLNGCKGGAIASLWSAQSNVAFDTSSHFPRLSRALSR